MATEFVAGCFGGCAGVLVGHPLDTIKVMLQVQNNGTGMIGCIKKVIANDSIRGLYRGIASPMSGVAFINASVFGGQAAVLHQCSDSNSIKMHALSGAAAGFFQSFICSPVELAKTRLQLGNGGVSSGPLKCLAQIVKREGFRAIFRGLGMTILRDTPAYACYFAAYEAMVKRDDNGYCSQFRVFMAGGLAGTASWLISFPFDAIKSRVQADGMTGPRMYTSGYDCLKKSVAAEGPSFLARGLTTVLLRAFPCNAACFLVVTWCLKIQKNYEQQTKQICDMHYAAHAYKSLLFASMFSETICSGDISELHEDFHNVKRKNGICGNCVLSIPVKLGILQDLKIAS